MKKIYLLTGLLCSFLAGSAQLTGTKNIPGDYADLSAAVTDLNAQGVGAGGVVLNVTANQTTTTGYTLTASGSATNPIVLQGNGKTISMTGSAAGSSDAIIALAGADYVTINNFILVGDVNTEWGILLAKKASAAPYDGCQNDLISNNSITLDKTNTGSIGIYAAHIVPGTTTTLSTTGIAASDAHSNNTIRNNTIGNVYLGIYFNGATASAGYDAGNTLYTNGITNFGGTGSNVYGIRAANFGSVLIRGNNVQSGSTVGSTAYGINVGATSGTALIDSNTVQMTGAGTSSTLSGIGSTGSSGTITISYNTITNGTYTTATSGAFNGIVNTNTTSPGPTLVISNNTVSNCTLSGTGTLYGIDAGVATASTIGSNTISGNSKSGASGNLYAIRLAGTTTISVTGNNITNNNIPNTSGSGTASLHGIVATGTLSGITETYSNNTITNQSIGGTTTSTNCTMYGIFPASGSMGTRIISGNVIGGFTNAAGGSVYGINQGQSFDISNTSTAMISANKVYDLNGNSSNSSVSGIYIASGQTITVVNNLVGDLKTPAAFANNPLNGINVAGGSTVNVYYNTVWLNASSTGTSFGSSALTAATSTTLKLFNNILINTSTSNGSGVTVAYRRGGTTLSSYTGNNNIFYAGTPGAFNLIYYDGTTSGASSNIQTLAAYQALVTPQDNNSKTENTTFISTTGSSTGFLHIAAATTTLASNAGQPVAGITTDYDGDARSATTPDIGADEFASNTTCDAPGTPAASNLTSSSATVTFTAGSGTAAFQWELRTGGTCGSGSPLQSGTATSGSFNLTGLTGGTTYTVCVRRDCGGGSFSSWVSATFTTTACPTITQQPSAVNTCTTGGASFTVGLSSTPAGTTYQWYNGATPVPGGTGASLSLSNITAANAGNYTVTITSPGCSVTSQPATLTVNQRPAAGFSSDVTAGCAPQIVNFTNSSSVTSGTLTYNWVFGDGVGTSIATNPTYTYSTAGSYVVALIASANGCRDTVAHTVTIGARPTASFTNTTPGCAPASVTFTNGSTGTGTLSYSWNFGDGSALSTTASPVHVFSTQGTYSVKLVVDNGSCRDSLTRTLTVSCTTAVSNLEAGISELSLLPNLVRGTAQLVVKATRAQVISWTLIDAQGRVLRRFTQRTSAGTNVLPLSLGDLAPGSYQLLGRGDKGGTSVLRFVRQ